MINIYSKIVILSGEGENGTFAEYGGEKTISGINAAVKKEECGGDRWVKVFVRISGDDYCEIDKKGDDVGCRTIPRHSITSLAETVCVGSHRIENIRLAKVAGKNVKIFDAYEYCAGANAYVFAGQFSAPPKTKNSDLENYID